MPKRQKSKKRAVSKSLQTRVTKLENMMTKTFENKVRDFNLVLYNGGSLNPDPVSTAGVSYLAFLRGLTAGPNDDNRVGNKITLMSQTFRGTIRAPYLPTDEQQNQVRILIVENLGFTGLSDLALNDVLQYGTFGVYGGLVFNSPYKYNASENKRYKVHYDKVISLDKTNKGYFQFTKRITYGTKKNRGKVLTYPGPLDQYPNNHRLNMFVISDSDVTSHPDIMWNVRNIYKDA